MIPETDGSRPSRLTIERKARGTRLRPQPGRGRYGGVARLFAGFRPCVERRLRNAGNACLMFPSVGRDARPRRVRGGLPVRFRPVPGFLRFRNAYVLRRHTFGDVRERLVLEPLSRRVRQSPGERGVRDRGAGFLPREVRDEVRGHLGTDPIHRRRMENMEILHRRHLRKQSRMNARDGPYPRSGHLRMCLPLIRVPPRDERRMDGSGEECRVRGNQLVRRIGGLGWNFSR